MDCKTFPILGLILMVLGLPAIIAAADSDSFAGRWEGAFDRGGSIQIVTVDLETRGDSLFGTYDIPELGLYEEPVKNIKLEGERSLTMGFIYGAFAMRLHPEIGEMTGMNAKWGPPVNLHLKRALKKPAAFKKESVRFNNGDISLSGTVYLPGGPGPYPAVVVVHGSGQADRSKWELRFYGVFLASRGFAALLYDRRGEGESTGNADTATFEMLADDAAAGFRFLSGRPDIDSKRIGFLGSSQGGWLAPLAASRLEGPAFLILNVAPSVSVEEQEADRVDFTMKSEGFSEAEIAEALAYTRLMFKTAYSGEGWPELEAAAIKAKASKWAEIATLIDSRNDLDGWRRQKYDPAPILKKTMLPTLVLYGEKDVVVPPARNKNKMEAYLREAGNRDFEIRVIPGYGHGMFLGQSLLGGRWEWPEAFWVWDKKSILFQETLAAWLFGR